VGELPWFTWFMAVSVTLVAWHTGFAEAEILNPAGGEGSTVIIRGSESFCAGVAHTMLVVTLQATWSPFAGG
jgi:hypothetical protein